MEAREWFDVEGVDMINDLSNSGAALAVAGVAKEAKRDIIVNGASNIGITNDMCSPCAIHYADDAFRSLEQSSCHLVTDEKG
ncbi:ABC transporter substrate-binding protein [uncultured Roseovarius sp.]|uniref:ABC transporter substrate-binding protein n=1 Tax=uncultured Roseovarius sp. TaxID=293344 RepID=UPI002607B541|nr:ABC transporter substrate-binding protein [uncultured Roseovarius sp.]